ncbi:hypothetical protein PFFVO_01923, partial [Plasmodium falciparum Vietnam Oak-Knoll (FVO)]
MAPAGSNTQDESAKHMFDRIGKIVHKKVRGDALQYNSQLLGHLSLAKFREGHKFVPTDAKLCKLNHEFDTNVTNGRSNPCYGRQGVRFSDTNGAECYWNRIKGNDKNNEAAACAPFRRLHMCDRNLEEIYPDKITNTNNLLLDVCLAAQYEGESIRNEYDQKKDDYKLGLCTALARSFADIGDIIRGKDLYRRDSRTDKLEENLKVIFENIYNDVTSGRNEKNVDALQTRYNGDKDPNYFQLREDWWEANRLQVWKALTCEAPKDSKYFRESSSDKGMHYEKCQCASGNVLTNFDYVPQYLRWFEEWAEDFCGKKKKFLDIVKTNCRGKNGTDRYCSFNGYDCEKTINKIDHLVMGNNCTKCSVACRLYQKWIENQKQEFIKQKKKYDEEIKKYINEASSSSGSRTRQRRAVGGTTATNYEEYEKKFYNELKNNGNYGTVNAFLNLLNKEEECKRINDGKGGEINFAENLDDKSNIYTGTFYRSGYCQRCPPCGVKRNGSGWENKQDGKECTVESTFNPPNTKDITKINVLYSGEEHGDMTKKLEKFCNANGKTYIEDEEWQCYYENSNNNMCKMTNAVANDKNHAKIMSFNNFFNFWVGHVLNDSIDWRTQLTKCLSENKLKKCEKGCKSNCECFKKWIEKKEKEWIEVKKQYDDQPDFREWGHYLVLETILEEDFLDDITKAYGDAEAIQGIKN